MSSTITSTTVGVSLTLASQNPATIVTSAYVTNTTTQFNGDAVYGSALTSWNLSNYGTIKATGSRSDGVHFAAGGTVSNHGTIAGALAGISFVSAGSVTGAGLAVNNYGLLSGAVGIIDGGGSTDTIVNHGRISGTSGAGITLGSGTDRVDNFGTISGAGGTAVAFGSGAGTVVIELKAAFNGALGGFSSSDVIDFAHVTATSVYFAGGALTLLNQGTVVPGAVVAVTGTFSPSNLVLASDGNGGVDVGLAPPAPTIVGTYSTPILLSNPAINNSATVAPTGLVAPSYGDAIIGGAGVPGTVANLGRIIAASPSSVGISLGDGGLVANGTVGFAGGYISGSLAGVKIGGGSATITNSGTIRGGSGILIAAGSSATVSNAGTIAGTSGTAVSLAGGSNRLILAPGALFQGKADGGGGKSVVEVAPSLVGLGMAGGATGAADTAAAAIYVSLGSVTNFSALQVDPGAATEADGSLSFDTLVNQGQINLAAGDSLVIGTVAGAANPGTIDLKSGGSLHFTGAVAASQTVLFRPPGGTVALDHPEQFAGALTEFATTDLIDLPLGKASFQQYSGGVLNLTYGGALLALQLTTTAVTPQFQFTDDGQGGTDITVSDAAACFCRGTRVLCEQGEVAVEDLQVGERVVTLSGKLKPIVWIGMGRDLVTRANRLARPIIVRRDALAENVPHRDLYLTHGHALYLDSAIGGVLIPVENLINHRSIVWDERARVVEYYHVELADHDVLLAEGAPAESYYDAGNRAAFHNTRPGSVAGRARPTIAPVLDSGAIVERVWARLFDRAGGRTATATTGDPDLHLVVDGARLDPAAVENGVFAFALRAAPAETLLLRSRRVVPSLVGLSRSDHRTLGVAIRQIVLHHAGIATWFDDDQPQLREGGCYPPEDGFCWTDGEFALPARFYRQLAGPLALLVHTEPHFRLRYPIASRLAPAA